MSWEVEGGIQELRASVWKPWIDDERGLLPSRRCYAC